jgi:hypothetical protein
MEALFSLLGPKPNFQPIVRESGSFTLSLKHVGAWVKLNAAGATVVTMPPLPTTEPAEGTIVQYTASGVITFSAAGGSTVNCRGKTSTVTTNAQWAPIAWKYDPVDREYLILGDATVT